MCLKGRLAYCILAVVNVSIMYQCFVYCTGESSFEVKFEADSNDITDDDRPRPYLCTVCDKRFTAKQKLNRHKQIHTTGKLYSCSQCEKCFQTQHYLNSHMNVHSSKYKCTECGKCFGNNRALTVHRRIHSGEKPFDCTVCCKRFTTSSHLVTHSRIHSGVKPHRCQLCDKTFSHSGEWRSKHSHESPHGRQTIQVFIV